MHEARTPLLSVRDLKVHFSLARQQLWPWGPRPVLRAVDGVSFDLYPGETLGIVGESGCGKSTLARALLNLLPPSGGERVWRGQDLAQADARDWRRLRCSMQMIFQDPLASLNPRMTVAQIIAEPLHTHRPELSSQETQARVRAMMQRVGLSARQINRYPFEFSGGQCQRIGIARALILQPQLLICDEPVSALDVSIRAQIINLLQSLQREMGLALIFIAHDLALVKHIADRILVMYLGREMEMAPKHALYAAPAHPYTQALLAAVPLPDPRQALRPPPPLTNAELPSPLQPPSGCVFRTRCPRAESRCAEQLPPSRALDGERRCSCLLL